MIGRCSYCHEPFPDDDTIGLVRIEHLDDRRRRWILTRPDGTERVLHEHTLRPRATSTR